MSDSFVHLHTHTDNSMLDGASRIGPLVDAAISMGMPAIAITDHGTMFGAFEFWSEATKKGIKPIIGIEAYIAPESRKLKQRVLWNEGGNPNDDVSGRGSYTHLTLLSENNEGMHNLFNLSSDSYIEGFYQKPRMDYETLAQFSKGIIATSGCASGEIQTRIRFGDYEGAKRVAATLQDIYGKENFFVEVMDHGIDIERRATKDLLRLADELSIPLVLTNDSHYVHESDADHHDALLCVQSASNLSDPDRFKFEGSGYFLKSPEQMRTLFLDHPEAADNTLRIAERCNVTFDTEANHMPRFPVPNGETESTVFEREVWAGLETRFPEGISDEVRSRAEYEIGVINDKGFPGYYLVVADFVGWAKKNGIRVGPGRGSGAGSLAAYALRITDLDPIEHGLFFERFLNPERPSVPDFDIDFSTRRRDDVKRYVTEKYGSDRVAQIATYSIIKAKQAVKDAARVLGHPFDIGDKLTKLIPAPAQGRDMSLSDMYDTKHPRYKEAQKFREAISDSADATEVLEIARGIENIKRSVGVHAAGVIMSDAPLGEILPLMMRDNDGQIITQFDFPTCEKLGLVKMDFLGLRNLDILDDCLENLRRNRGIELVLEDLPYDDPAVYELLSTGETLGIFQLDSAPMRSLLKQMQPDSFNDLSAALALFRPGPMGAKSHINYAQRKVGIQAITPIHEEFTESLADILDPTYGLIVFQEQVMQIAQRVAGYSLGSADALRKVMGKKDKDALKEQLPIFTAGMKERGYSQSAITALWDIMVPFSDYAFNKSHTAAYGVVAYFTAYLKAHYPAEFMAGLLTSVGDDRDKLGSYLAEARRMGVNVLAPDINESELYFAAVGDDVRFGLSSVKNVGEAVVELIVAERNKNGNFVSFDDFLKRAPVTVLNKRTIESLIKSGAFDRFGHSRRALTEVHERLVDESVKTRREESKGDFGFDFDELSEEKAVFVPDRQEWPRKTKLEFERDMLGLYVSDHPLNGQESMLLREAQLQVGDLRVERKDAGDDETDGDFELVGASEGEQVVLAGLLRNIEHRVARNSGNEFALAVLEDLSGSIDVSIVGRAYGELRSRLKNDSLVAVSGRVRLREQSVSLMAADIRELGSGNEADLSLLRLRIDSKHSLQSVITELDEVLKRHPGEVEVELSVERPEGISVYSLPHRLAISGTLYTELKRVLGANCFD